MIRFAKVILLLGVCVIPAVSGAHAAEKKTAPPKSKPAGTADQTSPGDLLRIQFTTSFLKAMATAKSEKRLVLLKPIFGGVDSAGIRDYRMGAW